MLYKETVSKEMWVLLQQLMKDKMLMDFNLVGGTALSLQIGHRLSIDIDLFTTKEFDEKNMLKYLEDKYPVKVRHIMENTILMDISKIKVDVMAHQYPWQKPFKQEEEVRLTSLEDIGAMKLHAIFQSGTRIKDFVDIYFLLEHHPLQVYLDAYKNKYVANTDLARFAILDHTKIDFEEKVMLIDGKEKSWNIMIERLRKAMIAPNLKFVAKEPPKQDQNRKRGRGLR